MRQKLQEIIKSWWISPLPVIYPRQIDLTDFFNQKLKKTLAVVGFRRVGKTFSLLDFAKKHGQAKCVYFNFEDDRLPKITETLMAVTDAVAELRGQSSMVFLMDEIQEIPDWSRWVRRMNETTPHRVIISGSSSRLSSSELPTELRGQTITIPMFPLTWPEYLKFCRLDQKVLPVAVVSGHLQTFLRYGGLPEIVLADEGLKPHILTDYYRSFVDHDIVERHRLRQREAFTDLLRLLPGTRAFTYSKLANTLKSLGHTATKDTVIRYLNWAGQTYFFSYLDVYHTSAVKRLQSPKKAYLIDNYFTLFYGSTGSENIGHLMEQAVFHQLQIFCARNPSYQLYYWKDFSQHEVDFVLTGNQAVRELIQVSYASKKHEIADREIDGLVKAARRFGISQTTLVTWDYSGGMTVKGVTIVCRPLNDWLMAASEKM
ncbi:MAG: hypothetical protein UY17_C0040G0007 [Candidatus Beckwithbacteria bacterium GW2011_GWC2_47_9]|uniref:ATPase n=1 Tax=Candidatus Beckwithbacteria bacterium GW2011_GWC2_47_9 TaxID=1618373 RepID=A0A0G1TY98_9BACT|nr:MAG: hypothetical protein UY17_C0040G0007 [Candidatus Beckwithbacteria bacterium GW2011_GWC2_47_9]